MEKSLEMRGMRRSEIVEYFLSINVIDAGMGKFKGDEWEVEVSDERFVTLGSLRIPSTTVLFRSKKEYLEPLIEAFQLKFLSAGG